MGRPGGREEFPASGPGDRETPRSAGENADLRDDLRGVTGALEVMPWLESSFFGKLRSPIRFLEHVAMQSPAEVARQSNPRRHIQCEARASAFQRATSKRHAPARGAWQSLRLSRQRNRPARSALQGPGSRRRSALPGGGFEAELSEARCLRSSRRVECARRRFERECRPGRARSRFLPSPTTVPNPARRPAHEAAKPCPDAKPRANLMWGIFRTAWRGMETIFFPEPRKLFRSEVDPSR
jgi:hypothetical protein